MTRWSKADDAKLITLWRTPYSGVDHTKTDPDSIKAVWQKYWPMTKYRNFSAVYRNKASKFGVSKALDGHR
jgi:hypothetical protein